jgi:glycosyltransferase involved in cell wall biosynthesis
MRVLFEISPLTIGGPQSWVAEMAPALRKRGVDVAVMSFALTPPKDSVMPDRLRSQGIPVFHTIFERGWFSKFKAVAAAFRNLDDFDVIHLNSDIVSGMFLPFARRRGIPVRVVHSRIPNWKYQTAGSGLKGTIVQWLFCQSVRWNSTHIFGVSKDALDVVPKGRQPCFVIPSAIQSERYSHVINRPSSPAREARMGFIGRLEPQKNPAFLLDVLSQIISAGYKGALSFVGYGSEETALRQLAAAKGIEKQVRFLGPVGGIDKILGSEFDVLMLPSHFEGTPRVVIEAQAAGVPVVCSSNIAADICIVPELVARLGLHEPPQTWASKVIEMAAVRVPEARVRSCFSSSMFDVEREADELLALYASFVKGNMPFARNTGKERPV